jgi:hypothetical protein
MRTQAWMILTFSALAAGLTGCGGDNSPGPSSSVNTAEQPPPSPSTTDFSVYAQSLVLTYSCETNPPADTNSIDFTFVPADMAQPVDTTDDIAACKV